MLLTPRRPLPFQKLDARLRWVTPPRGETPTFTGISVVAFWPLGAAYNAASFPDATGRGNDLTPYLRINPCTLIFRMGRNGSATLGPQQLFGALKGWGKWDRVLTSTEKAALAGGEYWPFSTTTTLQDAKAYFLLDEAGGSATYVDATGRGNNLTSTGALSRVAGPIGTDYGTNFTTGQWLTRTAPGVDLQSGQRDTTIAGWFLLNSKPSGGFKQQAFWSQIVNEQGRSGFNAAYDPTADRLCVDFDAGDNAIFNQGSLVMDNNFGSPAIGAWYHGIYELDLAQNQSSAATNNGIPSTLGPILQPIPVAGKIGNGSQFQLNPSVNFSTKTSGWDSPWAQNGNCNLFHAANTDISFGNNSKTVWGWFKTTDANVAQTLVGLYAGTGLTNDWRIKLASNTLSFVFGKEQATASVPMSDTSSFHLVVAWFDKTANLIHIDLDHGAQTASAAGPATPQKVSNVFRVGSDTTGGSGGQFRGVLNAWGIANGTPSAEDLATLWSSGTGWTL